MLVSDRPTALIVHGDGDILDLLTRWFEASGFEVVAAVSGYRAQASLEGGRLIDVVVAPWDSHQPLGGELYRWVLGHAPELRTRFVFIADEVPPEFDAVVGGRCLAVTLSALDDLVRIAKAVVVRVRTPSRGLPVLSDRPALLIVDDDPVVLEAIGEVLHDAGYTVFSADGGAEATRSLAARDFDGIVIDWRMHDGSGAALYRWICDHKPHLAQRVVFLAEGDDDDSGRVAPGRPMFRKGQDSAGLSEALRAIVSARS